jgi:pyrroline-5-carboxylate reductase
MRVKNMKLMLIGAGNLGSAILKGLKNFQVTVVESDTDKVLVLQKKYPNTTFLAYTEGLSFDGFTVIVAVKPQSYKKLKFGGQARAVISVMAGVKLEELRAAFKAEYHIRSMPNIAAMYGKSMTAVTGDEEYKTDALTALRSIGKVVWVASEKEIDIATALAGSGPAFLALVADAMSDAAVRCGMGKKQALEFTQGLFEGTAELLAHKHPSIIKDEVTSPGGTTAEGLAALEKHGVRDGISSAVVAAYEKATKF